MKKIFAEHKGKLILSSLVTLLPALVGRAWISAGLLAAHWLVLLIVFSDRRNRENQSRQAVGMIFWVMPFVSLLMGGVAVMIEQGVSSAGALSSLMALGFGLMFLLLGNYMPKLRQNSFMGIRVKWTLENEANWNATHRFGGKVWVAGGFACMAGALLPADAMGVFFLAVLLVIVALPIAYSYYYGKKQPAADKIPLPPVPPSQRIAARVLVAAVLVIAVWTLLMGSAEVQCGADSFTVEASGWEGPDRPVQRDRRGGVPACGGRPRNRYAHLRSWQPAGILRLFFPTRPTAAISATPTIPAKTASG